MLFAHLWIEPADVVAVFHDADTKRTRIKLSKPELHEVCCDLESGALLLKYLVDNEAKASKK